ncbi:hypothetical protein [Streptomyces sp. CB01580]|uniref:hypothetical protein n=1 Tax=Streptomyces sp. CB01580 TaxID=1703933 RepID=UPI000AE3C733|nr:hypothetical protein [Streptomyces sp. CB01580]
MPWSAEPLPGWEGDKHLHSTYRSGKPDSPGYTPEQDAEVARFQEELLRLSTEVSTHPYWQSLGGPDLVAARMALKHATSPTARRSSGPGPAGSAGRRGCAGPPAARRSKEGESTGGAHVPSTIWSGAISFGLVTSLNYR